MSAVASVVRSACPGVSVVVSDNSTSDTERGRLEEFCATQPSGVVRYVRPPEPLSMPAHWEWLWKLIEERVEPTHVAYLTDRFVFAAGALSELMGIVLRHPDHVLSYHVDHVNDLRRPVELVQTQWTGRLLELDAHRLAELSSRGEFGEHLPRMLNCIAPTGVLTAIERRFGDVFGPGSPDYRFAFRCLATRPTILYKDRACMIEHGMDRSNGTAYRLGRVNDAASEFFAQPSTAGFPATPEPGFETLANAIYQEYCSARAETGSEPFPAPHWPSYLTANAISIDRIAEPLWQARMRELLRRRGWTPRLRARHVLGLGAAITGYFARHPSALARSIKRQVITRPPGAPLAFLLARIGIDPPVGAGLRFDSAPDAIAYANAHPRPRTAHAWPLHRLRRAGAVLREHDDPREPELPIVSPGGDLQVA